MRVSEFGDYNFFLLKMFTDYVDAIKRQDVLFVQSLPLDQINLQDANGYTLLHIAVQERNPAIIGWLLEHDADTTIVDNNGYGAGYYYAHPMFNPAIEYLLGQYYIPFETLSTDSVDQAYVELNLDESVNTSIDEIIGQIVNELQTVDSVAPHN